MNTPKIADQKDFMNETLQTEGTTLPTRQALSREQIEILDHTVKRAANEHYCGGGKNMRDLVYMGLMKSLGFKSFVPDEYFTITSAGREALRLSQSVDSNIAST
jgi:hypothetical protein